MTDRDRTDVRRTMERAGFADVRSLGTIHPDGRPTTSAPGTVSGSALTPAMRTSLGSLPPRQRTVLELRHGVRDGRRWDFAAIGRRLGITPEHARRLAENGEARLRYLAQG